MAEDKSFELAVPEHPCSEMVWLSIKLACVLSAFERDRPADTLRAEAAEAVQPT